MSSIQTDDRSKTKVFYNNISLLATELLRIFRFYFRIVGMSHDQLHAFATFSPFLTMFTDCYSVPEGSYYMIVWNVVKDNADDKQDVFVKHK